MTGTELHAVMREHVERAGYDLEIYDSFVANLDDKKKNRLAIFFRYVFDLEYKDLITLWNKWPGNVERWVFYQHLDEDLPEMKNLKRLQKRLCAVLNLYNRNLRHPQHKKDIKHAKINKNKIEQSDQSKQSNS